MPDFLDELGIGEVNSGACYGPWIKKPTGGELTSSSPIDGKPIARVLMAGDADYDRIAEEVERAFRTWRALPAPKWGEMVRQLGDELRAHKTALGKLITLEMGKILAESLGEVQEMIDICDFAVGLSRQLYGLSMHSERPYHRMFEQWHPLGVVGIITAFNFPAAVWSWNAALATVCGDSMIWKPSSQTPLTAIAIQHISNRVMERNGVRGVFCLAVGSGDTIGERIVADTRVPLVSMTGSTESGKRIAETVARRLGRTILELGGNNAIIVSQDANLDLVVRAVLFGAVGTAGQRCTTTRRLLLQKSVAAEVEKRLVAAYKQVRIGDPFKPDTMMGPLVNRAAVDTMLASLAIIKEQGGQILYGGEELTGMPSNCYVLPTLIKARPDMPIINQETFAPILYLIEAESLEELIHIQNDVPQGLSSALFTNNLLDAERFLCTEGSDCGIANINIGTSGAEIGGAFGGEKETGGGREAGSDAWKSYMRRQTVTINYGSELPLAQGIKFGV
jgi:NAD-dependent aldehyde dehydrogenases